MALHYQIAFWNLENLFDIEDSPRRTDKLRRAIGSALNGWTQDLLDLKIAQLTSVVRQMNAGQGPDMLGVCEVENAHVMTLLVNSLNAALPTRGYAIEHDDTDDRRGIDVGFIYDANLFTPTDNFSHVVMRRTATRALFQVNFRTSQNRLFVVIGNHWPSRSGGEFESAGYRAIAGETLSYFHERIRQVHGDGTPVLAMGDFNDEPFNLSLTQYALAVRSRTKVVYGRSPWFYNLMWPVGGRGDGTFYFNNFPHVFDQFLANENLLKEEQPIRIEPNTATVFKAPEMTDDGRYPKPIRFGAMGKPVNRDGYSDHFPVVVHLRERESR